MKRIDSASALDGGCEAPHLHHLKRKPRKGLSAFLVMGLGQAELGRDLQGCLDVVGLIIVCF